MLNMMGRASMPSQIFTHPIATVINPQTKGIPTAFQALMP